MSNLGRLSSAAIPQLRDSLDLFGQGRERASDLEAQAEALGDAALPEIAAFLDANLDDDRARAALVAMARFPPAQTAPLVRKAMTSSRPGVRQYAAQYLTRYRDDGLACALANSFAAGNEPDRHVVEMLNYASASRGERQAEATAQMRKALIGLAAVALLWVELSILVFYAID